MYDALGVYLDGAANDDGRTILVVFTDGGDTRSALRFSEALTLLRASDVTVYSVGLTREPVRQRPGWDSGRRLTQLADESGGEAFFPRSMSEVEEAYATIEAQIRGQYTLGYRLDQHGPRRPLAQGGGARAPRRAAWRGGAHAQGLLRPVQR